MNIEKTIDVEWAKQLFESDMARLSVTPTSMFLVIGYKRPAARDPLITYRNERGEEILFEKTEEYVVASGSDESALKQSAQDYLQLVLWRGSPPVPGRSVRSRILSSRPTLR